MCVQPRLAKQVVKAKQIQLKALPRTIVITSDGTLKAPEKAASVHFSEPNRNTVLRRIDLPAEIDLTSITARMERGLLEVVASKPGAQTVPPKRRTKPTAANSAKPKATSKPNSPAPRARKAGAGTARG